MLNEKSKKNLKPFIKGCKPGPGVPKLTPEILHLRRVTAQDVAEIGQMIIMGDLPALKDVIRMAEDKDPSKRPTTLQVMIASGALQAIKKGDVTTLNALLDRFVGKIPTAIFVATHNVSSPITSDERKAEAKRLLLEIASDG